MKEKYTAIDLFCGAGGLSKGFMDAGCNVVLGIDFDEPSLTTFKHNHGSADAMKLDLFNHDNIYKIKEYLDNKNIKLDVLIGGPPCQGFSLAGKRDEFDKRNVLYSAMVKTAKLIKPKVVVLENVPGMITLYDGIGAKRVMKDFSDLGYNMNAKILYAPDYGVPQIRRRVVFVGILNGKNKFEYPKPKLSKDEYITCKEAIDDLPSLENDDDYSIDTIRDYISEPNSDYEKLMRKNSTKVYNHVPTKHTEKTIKNISRIPDGGSYKDLPPDEAKNFKYHESLKRFRSDKPSLTIDTGHRTHFHYKYNRIPTVRESARLQSFPDDFIFYGNKQDQFKQVGNAVPPLLGQAVAEKIIEDLKNGKI